MNDEAARRRKLIEATIATLAEVGFPAASLSEIARRAHVSTGLFAHYFGDKDGLLEATLRFMAARLSAAAATRLRAAANPRERLYAVCDSALADEEFDRPTGAVWLAFWGQVAHSPRYRRVQRLYERRMDSNLRHALRGLVAEERRATVAALIAAALDGLWLRARASGPGDGATARSLLRALIDGLLASPNFAPPPDVKPPPATRARPDVWRAQGPGERASHLRRGAETLRAAAPALARRESAETGRSLDATMEDALESARAFEAAAAFADGLRRTRVDLVGGRVEERGAGQGRAVTLPAHWSRPLLDLGGAAFALARGDAVRLEADPHAAPVLAEALARVGLPEAALILETHLFPPDPDARFGVARPKSAVIVLSGADMARAARAALRGGRA
jgi:betaine-aldehyde dehydrogenase